MYHLEITFDKSYTISVWIKLQRNHKLWYMKRYVSERENWYWQNTTLTILFCTLKKMKHSNRFFFFSWPGLGVFRNYWSYDFFYWGIGALQCVSAAQVNQLYLRAYPLPLGSPPTHLGHHRTLSWAPCALYLLPTPVLLPGKSHGRKSLVGCSPWGR